MEKLLSLADPAVSYQTVNNRSIYSLINLVRKGLEYNLFELLVEKSPFNIKDWSSFLHISERTMQRYQKENKLFDSLQTEKIVEITLLYRYGIEVFGDNEKFVLWLNTSNVALGGISPRTLLDNHFGIELVKDTLTRIEHGILA